MSVTNVVLSCGLMTLLTVFGACGDSSHLAGGGAAEKIQADDPRPVVVVYKNESCGCCGDWVKHMEATGFRTQVHNVDNLNSIKEDAGIPPAMGSCHTARVDKYFVEGHVPAADVKRLLAERLDAKGLTVPRMPIGSPGMESPSGEVEPYDVYLVANDGSVSVFAQHGR